MTRWNLVGSRSQPEEWGPLTKIVQVVADYVSPEGQKKLSDAEINDLTKTVVSQVEQSGLTPAQSPKEVAIPEKASSEAAPSANCRSLLMRLKR
jgi:hypothetical protein